MIESISNIAYCFDYVTDQISVDLLLYAHIPTSLVAIAFSLYILYKKNNVTSFSFFLLCLCFSIWSFLNLNSWFVFIGADNMMFHWALIDAFGLLFYFFSYRFLYTYIKNEDIPTWQWLLSIALIIPTFVTTFLRLNLVSFDLNECGAIENNAVVSYAYYVQLFFALACLHLGIRSFLTSKERSKRQEITFATTGVILFLGFFTGISFFVNFLITHTSVAHPYNYEIYGLFGMPVLLVFLGYLIVRYQAFDIKLVGAQAIVSVLAVLVGSQLFFPTSFAGFVVKIATLILVVCFGYLLVRSVKKEISQRERIEGLVVTLDKANERLKELDKMKSEFVSIASHQLRSPLTSIRGYTSMLIEGSYGKLPVKALEALQNISDSARFMALSIEDYLNISRIESGKMKYEFIDFSIKNSAEKIVDEMRPVALKKGLVLIFRSDCSTSATIHADMGKLRQVLNNLIDNAIKYTLKGTITVFVHDDAKNKTVTLTIKDTGVGISTESQQELFQKFVRAKNAHCVNVTGTGLGLYVAKKMVTEMGGEIWVESEGEGHGSAFHIKFPSVSHKASKTIKGPKMK